MNTQIKEHTVVHFLFMLDQHYELLRRPTSLELHRGISRNKKNTEKDRFIESPCSDGDVCQKALISSSP